MGLFDFFGGSRGERALKKHAGRVASKRSQNADRWQSIQALGDMGTAEAVEALLARFDYRIDPSITDQEEKDAAVQSVHRAGEAAVGPVVAFLRRADSVAWPLKCLEPLVSPDRVIELLIEILGDMDTEYERDPEKKIQILAILEDHDDPRILEAVVPFLEDVNETARFHAVATTLSQAGCERLRDELLKTYLSDDSVRVRARILDGFIERDWDLGDHAEEAKAKLPGGYAIDGEGFARRR